MIFRAYEQTHSDVFNLGVVEAADPISAIAIASGKRRHANSTVGVVANGELLPSVDRHVAMTMPRNRAEWQRVQKRNTGAALAAGRAIRRESLGRRSWE